MSAVQKKSVLLFTPNVIYLRDNYLKQDIKAVVAI